MDRHVIDCENLVTGAEAGICGRRFWRDMPGNSSGLPSYPRYAVIGRREHGSLLEIDDPKNNGC
jgi:hypothetical protein